MKIKKINEYFDTEELKANMEIPMLKGDLDPSDLVKNIDSSNVKFQNIYNILSYKFPFLQYCLDENNPYAEIAGSLEKNIFSFVFTNETWKMILSIQKLENGKYNVFFIRQGKDLIANRENTVDLGAPSPDYDPNKIFVERYEDLTMIDIWNKIENSFIPALKETGFGAILNLEKSHYDIELN
jgi:hypothetical protein